MTDLLKLLYYAAAFAIGYFIGRCEKSISDKDDENNKGGGGGFAF